MTTGAAVGSTPAATPSTETAPQGTTTDLGGGATRVNVTQPPPKVEPKAEPRPDWLPEKYKDVQAFVDAHKELEKKLGAPKEKPAETPQVPPPDAAKAVQDAGLDMAKLQAEFDKDGKLSEESYKAFESKGIQRSQVDAYVEGQKAVAEKYNGELLSHVGGQEAFEQIGAWAQQSLQAAEVEHINQVLASGNATAAKLALDGLKARFEKANGREPRLVNGEGERPVGIQPFRSNAEVVKAMQDPRYKNDPAYRAELDKRLDISPVFGGR